MIVLKDILKDFESVKISILIIIKRIKHSIEKMEYNRVRCDICEFNLHRVSYNRHLKSEKHLEKMSQKLLLFLEKIQ